MVSLVNMHWDKLYVSPVPKMRCKMGRWDAKWTNEMREMSGEKSLDIKESLLVSQNVRRFARKYLESCLERAFSKGLQHAIKKGAKHFDTIYWSFGRSTKGNAYILVLIDSFTKFIKLHSERDHGNAFISKPFQGVHAETNSLSCYEAENSNQWEITIHAKQCLDRKAQRRSQQYNKRRKPAMEYRKGIALLGSNDIHYIHTRR